MIAKLKMSLNEYITEKSKFELIIQILFNGVFALIILFGAYISVKMNRGGHSLWLDETALLASIMNRDYSSLFLTALDDCQSAPIIWILIIKTIITIFGNTEFNLRIFSVISYFLAIILACIIGRKLFKSDYPLGYGAFVALIEFFVKYSIVCKPYEFDAVCVLLVIFLFYLYEEKKINYIFISIMWSILIWTSNPVCFFQGGLLLVFFLYNLLKKNKTECFKYIFIGISIIISFLIYYYIWLRLSVDYMQDYWNDNEWPLLITSREDFNQLKQCIYVIFSTFSYGKSIIKVLFLLGLIFSLIKKEKIVLGIYVGFLVTVIASGLGYYPISDRLWCFSYPLIGVLSIYTLEIIFSYIHKIRYSHFILGTLISLLILSQTGWRYLYSFNLWWQHEEINAELDYLESVVTDSDNIYIYGFAERGYLYKYRKGEILDVHISTRDVKDVMGMVEDIVSLDNCYIVTNHYDYMDEEESLTKVRHILEEKGYIQLVYYDHRTALMYFCTDADRVKEEVNPDDYWY